MNSENTQSNSTLSNALNDKRDRKRAEKGESPNNANGQSVHVFSH
jgi:hypothetical protein